jgi:DNA topoisomerase VI subunit B
VTDDEQINYNSAHVSRAVREALSDNARLLETALARIKELESELAQRNQVCDDYAKTIYTQAARITDLERNYAERPGAVDF